MSQTVQFSRIYLIIYLCFNAYPCREITLPALSIHPPLKIAAKYWQRELNIHLCALICRPATSIVTSGLISSKNILNKSSPNLLYGFAPAILDVSVSSVLPSVIKTSFY